LKSCIPLVTTVWAAFGLGMATIALANADFGDCRLLVSVTPDRVRTSVGESVELLVTVASPATGPTPETVVHLDITDPVQEMSVDPEDWTTTLTQAVPPVETGKPTSVSWTIAPPSAGDFLLYAVAVDPNAGVEPTQIAVSNGVPVHVAERRPFNPQGILPLAIAVPALIGAVLIWRRRRLVSR